MKARVLKREVQHCTEEVEHRSMGSTVESTGSTVEARGERHNDGTNIAVERRQSRKSSGAIELQSREMSTAEALGGPTLQTIC